MRRFLLCGFLVFAIFCCSVLGHEDPVHDGFDPDCPGVQLTLEEAAAKLRQELRAKMIPFLLDSVIDENGNGGYELAYDVAGPYNSTHRQLISQARTLHTLSLLHNLNSTPEWHKTNLLAAANMGYAFLESVFKDSMEGGYYWSADADGRVTNQNKNTEGQMAVIHAYVEYSRAVKNKTIARQAQELYDMLTRRIQDSQNGGYFSDFEEDWTPIQRPVGGGPAMSYGLKTQTVVVAMLDALTELYLELERTNVEIALEQILDDDVKLFFPRNPARSVESRLWNNREYRVGGSMAYGVYVQYIAVKAQAEKAIGRDIDWKTFDRYLNYSIEEGMNLGGLTNNDELLWWASDNLMNALTFALREDHGDEYEEILQSLFHFQTCYLIDPMHGMSIWSVDRKGHPSFPVILGPWKSGYSEISSKINFVKTVLED